MRMSAARTRLASALLLATFACAGPQPPSAEFEAAPKEGVYVISTVATPQQKGGGKPVVALPNPFYQAYLGGAVLSGAEPLLVNANAETGFLPDFLSIDEATWIRQGIPDYGIVHAWEMDHDSWIERVLAVEGDKGVERVAIWLNGDGAAAADATDPATLTARALAHLAKIRPASAGKLKPAFAYSWGRNRFSGGIRHVLDAGQAARFGPILDRPHGRIQFAGEHMRREEHGMEAAVETAERAARRILAA